jgi:hypothetical protein
VSSIDPSFATSGGRVELECLRVWPLGVDAAGVCTRRIECLDANRGASISSVGNSHVPIECELIGPWSDASVLVRDTLTIVRPSVVASAESGSMEHAYKLILDGSEHCAQHTQLRVREWKHRVLMIEGRYYTHASLQRDAQRAAAAPIDASQGAAAGADTGPASKKRKQRAAPAAGGTSDAPISVDSPPSKHKKKTGSEIHGAYAYSTLSEIRRRTVQRPNFYGVVLFAKGPSATRGSDLIMNLSVSDLSLPVNESMPINIFRLDGKALPKEGEVRRGDIVRVHRVDVTEYQGQPIGTLAQKKGGSFILMRGGIDDTMVPYFTPNESQYELEESWMPAGSGQ